MLPVTEISALYLVVVTPQMSQQNGSFMTNTLQLILRIRSEVLGAKIKDWIFKKCLPVSCFFWNRWHFYQTWIGISLFFWKFCSSNLLVYLNMIICEWATSVFDPEASPTVVFPWRVWDQVQISLLTFAFLLKKRALVISSLISLLLVGSLAQPLSLTQPAFLPLPKRQKWYLYSWRERDFLFLSMNHKTIILCQWITDKHF